MLLACNADVAGGGADRECWTREAADARSSGTCAGGAVLEHEELIRALAAQDSIQVTILVQVGKKSKCRGSAPHSTGRAGCHLREQAGAVAEQELTPIQKQVHVAVAVDVTGGETNPHVRSSVSAPKYGFNHLHSSVAEFRASHVEVNPKHLPTYIFASDQQVVVPVAVNICHAITASERVGAMQQIGQEQWDRGSCTGVRRRLSIRSGSSHIVRPLTWAGKPNCRLLGLVDWTAPQVEHTLNEGVLLVMVLR